MGYNHSVGCFVNYITIRKVEGGKKKTQISGGTK